MLHCSQTISFGGVLAPKTEFGWIVGLERSQPFQIAGHNSLNISEIVGHPNAELRGGPVPDFDSASRLVILIS